MKRILLLVIWFCFSQNTVAQTIKVSKRVSEDSIYLDFINPFYAPMEMNLYPLDSTKSIIKVNSYGILKYNDTLKNALVIPINKIKDTTKISVKPFISFKANFGDPNNIIDENYRYSLPYPIGEKYKIVQSFGGKFSHNKPHSKYAIDFGTKVGDTITAVRDGIVFFVKEDSKEHCRTRKCVDKGNKVLILHNDGTMAHYVHLDFEGAIVEVGDTVEVGQPIAISGMTGFTTTPHLHLVIYKSGGISIPFYFKGQKRKKLRQGKYYRRLH
ncbi:M23 family metallopeptidase [uncultured Winogradskyella sp.]|uniref:M23 family metallopeptidase n=1 Tax=uncultured Winogradskyella sp. TaxID=395353 RepID=UPI0026097480|nr:M23 family metallopeptidase [uncultured Winogradskyella sp.]